MANSRKKTPLSVEGEFFVDRTCIDCETCAQLAPEIFAEHDGFFYVSRQPRGADEVRMATRALLSCPVGAIGTLNPNQAKIVMRDFPLSVDGPVYYCGFNSRRSFGGNSYFVKHRDGNWLIDSPKFLPHLSRRFAELGGLRYIFLTHQDDVADAALYAREFGATRIIHRADSRAQRDAEMVIDGLAPLSIDAEFKIIPTPGHTRGHCVLLFDDRFLFTGDHLWWEPEVGALGASRNVCWYSWSEQTASMSRLLDEKFEWVLPGHGDRGRLPVDLMHSELAALVARMRMSERVAVG
jgi:glyoxylase-like metal-dependent hydrolase (beta-lactamase superfamily II)/ferredoxin